MKEDELDFTGRAILITGAASGMGELSAREFAKRGGKVMLADINLERAEAIAEEIRQTGGTASAVKTDVRKFEDIDNAVKTAEKLFGSVDVTVSFAGGEPARMLNRPGSFVNQDIEVIDWGLEVNGRAPVYMARAVLKGMIERKRGVILNISSVIGIEGNAGCVVYSTAKSALMAFTKSIAALGAPYVRCCCIAPGPVLTRPGMASMKTALGRAAEPMELVNLVLFLASDKASFCTGDTWLADGGRTCIH